MIEDGNNINDLSLLDGANKRIAELEQKLAEFMDLIFDLRVIEKDLKKQNSRLNELIAELEEQHAKERLKVPQIAQTRIRRLEEKLQGALVMVGNHTSYDGHVCPSCSMPDIGRNNHD